MSKAAIEVLNRAFAADPAAIRKMMANRVPCNQALADDSTVIVGDNALTGWDVGPLGLINGILVEMGHEPVAAIESDEAVPNLLGFCDYVRKS